MNRAHTVGLGLTRDARGPEKVARRREGSPQVHQPGSAAAASPPAQPDFHFPSSQSEEVPSPRGTGRGGGADSPLVPEGGAPRLHLSHHKGALSSVLRAWGRPEAAPQPPSRSQHPQSAAPTAPKPDPRGWHGMEHSPLKSHYSS